MGSDANKRLLAAVSANDRAAVERALADGADPDASDWTNATALYIAVCKADAAVVRALLAAGAGVDRLVDGRAPLAGACAEAHVENVRVLLEAGADPNLMPGGNPDHAALCAAASAGEMTIVEELLARAPRPEIVTAALWAAGGLPRMSHTRVMLRLLEAGASLAPRVTRQRVNERLEETLQYPPLNNRDRRGETVLMHAVRAGKAFWVHQLLGPEVRAGFGTRIDVWATNTEGMSALMIAADRGDAAAVKLLLLNGAERYPIDREGRDARALARGNPAVLAALTQPPTPAALRRLRFRRNWRVALGLPLLGMGLLMATVVLQAAPEALQGGAVEVGAGLFALLLTSTPFVLLPLWLARRLLMRARRIHDEIALANRPPAAQHA